MRQMGCRELAMLSPHHYLNWYKLNESSFCIPE
jgi:hypothetical protein